MRQHTIRKAVSLEGVALHSGKMVRVTLSPGPADSGIVFRVGEHGEPIPAAPAPSSHQPSASGHRGLQLDQVLPRLRRLRRCRGGWTALCPAHDDHNPSLSIAGTDDGRVLVHCFAGCAFENVIEALGLRTRESA